MDNNLENTTENQNTEGTKEQQTDTKGLEARIKALESENSKLKNSVTNASADASEWKKKYQSKLSEEEKAKQTQDEQTAAMQRELEDLRKERNIARFTSTLVAKDIGMESEVAQSVAEALHAGDTEKVFDGIRKFITSHDKALHENALRNNPTLASGAVEKTVSKAEFDAMGYKEMVAFKHEHPDLYNEYMK